MKKSIEDIKCQESISNSSVLKEELSYLWNDNLNKTSIIKSLTENHCVSANVNSDVFPANLHHEKVQDEKHKSTPNKLYESPKTMAKVLLIYMKSRTKGIKKSIKISGSILLKEQKHVYLWFDCKTCRRLAIE